MNWEKEKSTLLGLFLCPQSLALSWETKQGWRAPIAGGPEKGDLPAHKRLRAQVDNPYRSQGGGGKREISGIGGKLLAPL